MKKLLIAGLALCALAAPFTVKSSFADINEKDFSSAMERYMKSDSGQKSFVEFMQGLQQKQMELARKKQDELQQAKLEEQFKNPVKVEVGSSPVKGPAGAKVTIVEFSDFECPYCQKGGEVMAQVLKAYPNDVKVAFKHLPLPFHQNAKPAALASFAAQKQGKFWEFHDALFANQRNLTPEFFTQTATKLGLNMEQFKKDMASPEAEAAVKNDSDTAQKLGIGGTPAFVVNGVQVNGAYPFEHFKGIIDRLLSAKS
jgi:protein-disulfide isomerase